MSKIYKVQWTSNAKEDLLNIVDYIKKDSLNAARKAYAQVINHRQSRWPDIVNRSKRFNCLKATATA